MAGSGNIRGRLRAGLARFVGQAKVAGGPERQNRGTIQAVGNDGKDPANDDHRIGKRKQVEVVEARQSGRLIAGSHSTDQRYYYR